MERQIDLVLPVDEARRRLLQVLQAYSGGLLVAYSGGVDSACLLAEAAEALPGRVAACLDRSPSLPERELAPARTLATGLGVRLVELDPGALENPAYRANPLDRCYYCKNALFRRMKTVAGRLGLRHLAYGAQADDLGGHRPGARAALEHGVVAPLLDAGLGKAEVRALAADRGLPVACKPAAPCLASRVPYGREVNEETLRQVDRAEAVLWAEGFSDCRVRYHGAVARIEVPAAELPRMADAALRRRVEAGMRAAGFAHVAVDPAGLRSGSLNPPSGQNEGTRNKYMSPFCRPAAPSRTSHG